MRFLNVINKQFLLFVTLILTIAFNGSAQSDTAVYHLTIDQEIVNKAGKTSSKELTLFKSVGLAIEDRGAAGL